MIDYGNLVVKFFLIVGLLALVTVPAAFWYLFLACLVLDLL